MTTGLVIITLLAGSVWTINFVASHWMIRRIHKLTCRNDNLPKLS